MTCPHKVAAVVPDLQFLEAREHFLPVQCMAMQDRMLADPRLSADEREYLRRLFDMLAARFHFEFHKKLEHLKALYDPFDPDCDTVMLPTEPANREAQRQALTHAFRQLLVDANYVEMPHRQIIACAEYPSQTRLVVKTDLSRYAQLRVFYRGIKHETQTSRPWLTPWKKLTRTVHIFSRVALLVRLASDPPAPAKKADGQNVANPEVDKAPVFLKLFKSVVVEDLEMLLPYVRIRMRLLDHLKIGSSVAGGVATASWKAFTASVLSPWLLLLVMSGFVGAAIRGLFGFLSSKTKYMQTLSSNLYFQNLANNASALAHLTDCAESEEHKELLLAYYILYVERRHDYTQEQLGRRVEQWLKTEFGLDVTVDASEAVRKLVEKNLLVRSPLPVSASASADNVLRVYDLPSALRRLDAVWDAYYSYAGVRLPDQDRLADANWPACSHDKSEPGEEAAATRRVDEQEEVAASAPHAERDECATAVSYSNRPKNADNAT
jgi:hypothetical protein